MLLTVLVVFMYVTYTSCIMDYIHPYARLPEDTKVLLSAVSSVLHRVHYQYTPNAGAGGLMWNEKGQMCYRIDAAAQPALLDDNLKPDGQTETDERWHCES